MLRGQKFKLQIIIDRRSKTAVYLQIARVLVDDICRGRLRPGSVLPGTRELANAIGVNRKTVVNVYDELAAQGWLTSSGTKGTFVSAVLPLVPNESPSPKIDVSTPRTSERNSGDLNELPTISLVYSQAGLRCLDDGSPDARLFPAAQFSRAYRGSLATSVRLGKLGYTDPRGSLSLRASISHMLNAERGLAADPDHVCLTRGSQMAIYMIAKALIRPGDTVAVEELTYPAAREAFRALGARILTIPVDGDGLDVRYLETACRQQKIRFVYVTPHHHFPTTRMLSKDRRVGLLHLANTHDMLVLEDDYDYEFNFGRQHVLPLASQDPINVLYVGSLSKLLSPNLRIGFVVAHRTVIDHLAKEVVLIDRQGDQATADATAELIETGEVNRHARRALTVYARRREMFAELLRSELGEAVDFHVPDCGLAFWLTFRSERELDLLESRADRLGLRFLPSRCFADHPAGRRGLRIGFAALNEPEAMDAVRRLKIGLGLGRDARWPSKTCDRRPIAAGTPMAQRR